MIRSFIELVRHWYERDRIRISPYDGKWLGLTEGSRILIRSEIYFVTKRHLQAGDFPTRIDYDLAGMSKETELARVCVRMCHRKQKFLSAQMEAFGHIVELFEEDLVVL